MTDLNLTTPGPKFSSDSSWTQRSGTSPVSSEPKTYSEKPGTQNLKKREKPPSIRTSALLKNILQANRYRAQLILEACLEKGDLVSIPVPGRKVYLVTHPRDIEHVLSSHASNYRKSFDYRDILSSLLGSGLLTSDGEVWQQDRRMIQPIFHQQVLRDFSNTMVESTQEALERWSNLEIIDLAQETTLLTLRIISRKLLSSDLKDHDALFERCFGICQKQIVRRGMALVDFAKYFPTPNQRRFNRAVQELDQLIYGLIQKRKDEIEKDLGHTKRDLLSMLMSATDPSTGQSLTPTQIRDQFVTLFLAGHDTTAMALTWTLFLVSQNPEVEAQLFSEISQVLKGQAPHFTQMKELTYTRAVLEESMRLFPPVPFLGREAIESDFLADFPIPAGSTLIISPFATQRRPDLWEQPNRFEPKRFLENRHPRFAYLPFGGGPRTCIGSQFAMMEMQLILSMLIQRYRFEFKGKPDIEPIALISLRPNASIWMKPTCRHNR